MKRINLTILIVISLVSLVSADVGDNDFGGCWGGVGGMMTGIYGYNGMFFGWLIGLLIIVTLILLIVWLIKQIQKK